MRLARRPLLAVTTLVAAAALATTASASAPATTHGTAHLSASAKTHPIFMPNVLNQWPSAGSSHRSALQPPVLPCYQYLGQTCQAPVAPPAAGEPYAGNMAYWGGHVQVAPKIYLILWGWGQPDAFKDDCNPSRIDEGSVHVTLKCDPIGAGHLMADFVYQMGGTAWAGVQTQYYQTVKDSAGNTYEQHITNPKNQLGGIWVDDTNRITAKVTYTNMAQEAERAMRHFHVTDLANANFVIAQPQLYSDPEAAKSGYCAFHDYTAPDIEGGIYKKVTPGLSYTNMPYVADQGAGCGAGSVNTQGKGKLDGVTLALGHEIEETVTDPGAEDISNGKILGGWFDAFDGYENGDKCAYVGDNLTGIGPNNIPLPGGEANIRGNHGGLFAVQGLWSNNAAEGVGWCAAGAGNDLPQPVPPV